MGAAHPRRARTRQQEPPRRTVRTAPQNGSQRGNLSAIRSDEPRFLWRRAEARGDEFLVFVGREVTDPRGVGGLVGVDLLGEGVAPLRDDDSDVRDEHPHVRDERGRRDDEQRPGVVGAAVGKH